MNTAATTREPTAAPAGTTAKTTAVQIGLHALPLLGLPSIVVAVGFLVTIDANREAAMALLALILVLAGLNHFLVPALRLRLSMHLPNMLSHTPLGWSKQLPRLLGRLLVTAAEIGTWMLSIAAFDLQTALHENKITSAADIFTASLVLVFSALIGMQLATMIGEIITTIRYRRQFFTPAQRPAVIIDQLNHLIAIAGYLVPAAILCQILAPISPELIGFTAVMAAAVRLMMHALTANLDAGPHAPIYDPDADITEERSWHERLTDTVLIWHSGSATLEARQRFAPLMRIAALSVIGLLGIGTLLIVFKAPALLIIPAVPALLWCWTQRDYLATAIEEHNLTVLKNPRPMLTWLLGLGLALCAVGAVAGVLELLN